MRIVARLFVLLFTTILFSGCTTTEFVNRWSDPAYKGPKFQRILVIGMLKDDIKRRAFEDKFSQSITKGNVVGISSYTLMPNIENIDDKVKLLPFVKKANADSVLIASLTAIDKKERRVPASVDWVPTMGYGAYNGFYDYYGRSYRNMYAPVYQSAYTTTDTIIKIEIRLFAVSTEKLVWAAETESINPGSSQKVINELSSIILKDLKKSGLVN